MGSIAQSRLHPPVPLRRLRAAAAAGLLAALGVAGPRGAVAHVDLARESGIVQLDSATAVASGESPATWRNASPLAVPDQFGPGAVLGVGNVHMKVINNAVLGNPFTNTSTDPSAQWPGNSGVEYLNAIALAVGAVNPTATDPNAIRRVSYFREWRPPTLNPEDRIYRAYDGIINGQRNVNDDGDFILDPGVGRLDKIDEDFLDGHDNDGDGKIDEDHGALGQQEFSFVMRDDTREAVNTVAQEKHVPLGLEARVRAWGYSIQGFQDFNVCEYQITNVSGHELDSLTIGWLVDMDSGPTSTGAYWTDDIDFPQYPQGEFIFDVGGAAGDLADPARAQTTHDRSLFNAGFPKDTALCPHFPIRVNAFTVGDQDGDAGRTPGMGTFMLIDYTTDPTGVNAPRRVQFRAFRSTTGGIPYGQGGLPRIDQERFESMESTENVDPVTGFINAMQGATKGDYTEWCSVGPWLKVDAGQSITATIAFGVQPCNTALANGYTTDYQKFQNHVLTAGDLFSRYPSLQNAINAQLAFEGVYDKAPDYSLYVLPNPTAFHGRETPVRLPRGSPPVTIIEPCADVKGHEHREVQVNDRDYSWFDFDCDYCTGVWDSEKKVGLFHKTWNAAAPPPNPNTNASAQYNFTDNPNRDVAPAGDRVVRLAWDNLSEVTVDPKSRWRDFRGFSVWKVSDWLRPVGSSGPLETDWRLIGEFRAFDYYTANIPTAEPLERNYRRELDGTRTTQDSLWVPNYYDPTRHEYGKYLHIALDRFDLWNRQSGEVIKPNWTIPCVSESAADPPTPEINTGDIEFDGGSATHTFAKEGTYTYLCLRHPRERGTVIVQAVGADSAVIHLVDGQFFQDPATDSVVTVRKGGYVRWANASQANHAPQSDRHCTLEDGVILNREDREDSRNHELRVRFPVGRYEYVDHEVKNGFVYFYSVTAFDSTTDHSITTQLGGRRSAVEADAVTPEASTDSHGKKGVWVVPNPYRGYARLQERPSSWDLTPNASDPTGTHLDFMGLPPGRWTIRIYTVSGDLVQELHSTDAVNESVRQSVIIRNHTYAGYNRQQDNPNDGQARWNLISRNGQDIVSGIYLFTVESPEGTQRGKFVVIR